jgi:hypothetical protein
MTVKLEIIENFLSENDLRELQSVKLKKTNYKEMNVYVKKIKDNFISGTGIEEESVRRLHKNYHSLAIEVLKKLYPEKIKLYEYSEFGLTDTGPDYEFPIHNDTPNKILSGVIYISPENNVGTKFYNSKNAKDEYNVDWKINRAVFFSREERKSWHSFNGDKTEVRRVLIYNLMTTNVKEVCKIENINYFLVKFKHIINPYLYKFFKFVI